MTTTKIEWCVGDDGMPGTTWNPVTGCTKVSPGCAHCYAEGVAERFWAKQYPSVELVMSGSGEVRPRQFTDVWTHADRLDQPLRWRKPQRIFVNSMSDLFHEDVPDSFIDQVFAVMALAPQHTFQVLTKRADRMREYMTYAGPLDDTRELIVLERAAHIGKVFWDARGNQAHLYWNAKPEDVANRKRWPGWPLPNVWLGVSVENQHFADERIPLLLRTPAAVRFISAEPLLGQVNLTPWLTRHCLSADSFDAARMDPEDWTNVLDWVIVGGESGPKARPCDIAWIRSIRQQCRSAGVPCFVKQLGANPDNSAQPDGSLMAASLTGKANDPAQWPEDLRVREFPVGVQP